MIFGTNCAKRLSRTSYIKEGVRFTNQTLMSLQNGGNTSMTNPVAKPPRLTDLQPYNTTGHLSANGARTINGTIFHPANGEPDNKAIGNSASNPGS